MTSLDPVWGPYQMLPSSNSSIGWSTINRYKLRSNEVPHGNACLPLRRTIAQRVRWVPHDSSNAAIISIGGYRGFIWIVPSALMTVSSILLQMVLWSIPWSQIVGTIILPGMVTWYTPSLNFRALMDTDILCFFFHLTLLQQLFQVPQWGNLALHRLVHSRSAWDKASLRPISIVSH